MGGLSVLVVVTGNAGVGDFREASVQPRPNLLRCVRTTTPLRPGDRHPGGGDPDEGRRA